MTTKANSVSMNRGIYDGPYDAFTNYMNILGDFISRVNSLYPADMDNEELNSLLTTIKNQGEEIEAKDKEIAKLRKELDKNAKAKAKSDEVKPAAKKTTAKKATTKK
jgi:alpha-amylase